MPSSRKKPALSKNRTSQQRKLKFLGEHQRMVLLGSDRDTFMAAIERNPRPAPRLVEALKRHSGE